MKRKARFVVPIDIYEREILFLIGYSSSELKKYISSSSGRKWFDSETAKMVYDASTSADGLTIKTRDGGHIVWIMNGLPKIQFSGTLSHEIFHACHDILEYKGIKLSKETCEAYAYMVGFITTEVYRKLA